MADSTQSILGGGVSGAGENSTSPPQTFQAQQDAIQKAFRAQEAAATAAGEAAHQAAIHRPATNGSSGNEFTNVSFKPFNPAPIPMAVPDKSKSKKGK
jgi:hypothetical protein